MFYSIHVFTLSLNKNIFSGILKLIWKFSRSCLFTDGFAFSQEENGVLTQVCNDK